MDCESDLKVAIHQGRLSKEVSERLKPIQVNSCKQGITRLVAYALQQPCSVCNGVHDWLYGKDLLNYFLCAIQENFRMPQVAFPTFWMSSCYPTISLTSRVHKASVERFIGGFSPSRFADLSKCEKVLAIYIIANAGYENRADKTKSAWILASLSCQEWDAIIHYIETTCNSLDDVKHHLKSRMTFILDQDYSLSAEELNPVQERVDTLVRLMASKVNGFEVEDVGFLRNYALFDFEGRDEFLDAFFECLIRICFPVLSTTAVDQHVLNFQGDRYRLFAKWIAGGSRETLRVLLRAKVHALSGRKKNRTKILLTSQYSQDKVPRLFSSAIDQRIAQFNSQEKAKKGPLSAYHFYAYLALCQSSMTGKTKSILSLSEDCLLFYINLRPQDDEWYGSSPSRSRIADVVLSIKDGVRMSMFFHAVLEVWIRLEGCMNQVDEEPDSATYGIVELNPLKRFANLLANTDSTLHIQFWNQVEALMNNNETLKRIQEWNLTLQRENNGIAKIDVFRLMSLETEKKGIIGRNDEEQNVSLDIEKEKGIIGENDEMQNVSLDTEKEKGTMSGKDEEQKGTQVCYCY